MFLKQTGAQNCFEKDSDAWVDESLDEKTQTVGLKSQTYGDNNK